MGRRFWFIVLAAALATGDAVASFKLVDKTAEQAFPGINGQLVQAALDGDSAKMERLVKDGANPNGFDDRFMTPLVWAVSANAHKGIAKLLELGANPNMSLYDDRTAMWIAAWGSDDESLKIILEHGGDPNRPAYKCETPLMASVRAFRLERVKLMLDHGADVNGQACGDNAPALAATFGHFDMTLYMLEHGYNTDLDKLANELNDRSVPVGSDVYVAKAKCFELLRQRGAKIPPLKQTAPIDLPPSPEALRAAARNDPYPGDGGHCYNWIPSKREVASHAYDYDPKNFASFKLGVTTKSDVAKALGRPRCWRAEENGYSNMVYEYYDPKRSALFGMATMAVIFGFNWRGELIFMTPTDELYR